MTRSKGNGVAQFSGTQSLASIEEAARAALAQWPGDFHDIRLLKVRENAVFSARREDGSRAVLRLHRADYHSDGAIRSELAWMAALAAAGQTVPKVIPTRAGDYIAHIEHPSFCGVRQADLLTWIEGRTIGTVGEALPEPAFARRHFQRLGELAASFHNHAEHWVRPVEFERQAWDIEALIGPAPMWGRFWELEALSASQRQSILAARDAASANLAALACNAANYGLIHADLIPDNVLVSDAGLAAIDFDDCGPGWHMFELATILFVHLEDPGYPVARDALIEGYRSVRKLDDDMLDQLPLFLFLRSTTYLGWLQTRSDSATPEDIADFLIESCEKLASAFLDTLRRRRPAGALRT